MAITCNVLIVLTSFLCFEGNGGTWQAFVVAVDGDDASGDSGHWPQVVDVSAAWNTSAGLGSTRR